MWSGRSSMSDSFKLPLQKLLDPANGEKTYEDDH